jgi:hypothetical protein
MVAVQDGDELAAMLLRLFGDDKFRMQMGEHARDFVAGNRGALAKQLQYSKVLIDEKLQIA